MVIRQVLLDVSTQRDFLDEGGAVPVANRVDLVEKLRQVHGWVGGYRIPVISALDSHREVEPLNGMPRHCTDGSWGQQKVPFTLIPDRILVEADNSFTLPVNVLGRHRQVIFRKRTVDFLANPKADRLLTELRVREFVVCGVGIENGIKALVLGLLSRHKRVALVWDACGYWNRTDAELSLRQMEAKGASLVTVEDLLESRASGGRGRDLVVRVGLTKRRRAARPRVGMSVRVQG